MVLMTLVLIALGVIENERDESTKRLTVSKLKVTKTTKFGSHIREIEESFFM